MIFDTPTSANNVAGRVGFIANSVYSDTDQFILLGGTTDLILDGIASIANSYIVALSSDVSSLFSSQLAQYGQLTYRIKQDSISTITFANTVTRNYSNYSANIVFIDPQFVAIANTMNLIEGMLSAFPISIQDSLDNLSSSLASAVKVISARDSTIVKIGIANFPVGASVLADGINANLDSPTIGLSIAGPNIVYNLQSLKSSILAANTVLVLVSSILTSNVETSLSILDIYI